MKQVTLTLAALAVLGLAANQAFAKGALSHPMAAHVAAKRGVYQTGPRRAPPQYQRGHQKHRSYQRHPHKYGPVVIHPRVVRPPVVISPLLRPYYPRPYYYAPRPYYYVPHRGLSYSVPGFSIGVGW